MESKKLGSRWASEMTVRGGKGSGGWSTVRLAARSAAMALHRRIAHGIQRARDEEGQGTTEYAILVGVLVVIAIAAVVLFRDRIQSLWDAIASGINSL